MTREPEFLTDVSNLLGEFLREHALAFVCVLGILFLVQSLRLFWLRSLGARRLASNKRMGAEGERRARHLLEKCGYRIIAQQQGGRYALTVDGESVDVHLRADFVVEKKGDIFVAEVKAGVESAKITARATRRQLLEYSFAFEVDGVILLDMHTERVVKVSFPLVTGH